ncbi:MAG: DUF2177 family protein [Pirellulaceae bacterium]|nr:DUF2177 family protein [Pirellulaceae bacterium]
MPTWKLLLIVIPVVALIDLLYLGVIAKSFYDAEVGDLARRSSGAFAPRWGPAIAVYLLIPAGIVLFVRPAMGPNAQLWQAALWGALFGLVLYGTYDFTNRCILEKWSLRLTLADIAWGCVLCGLGASIMWLAERWLGSRGA